jgi:hypothetical protein
MLALPSSVSVRLGVVLKYNVGANAITTMVNMVTDTAINNHGCLRTAPPVVGTALGIAVDTPNICISRNGFCDMRKAAAGYLPLALNIRCQYF